VYKTYFVHVEESIVHKKNPQFKPPDDENAKIWRYMSIDRYKDLISSGCLYFCEGNRLLENDPYEGSYLSFELLKEVSDDEAADFAKKMKSCGPPIKVNCWHLNEFESMAMWRIYGREVAVQSTYKRLVKALEKCPCGVRIGEVLYIVHGKEFFKSEGPVTVFVPWLHKHRSFDYERELRAIIWETDDMPVQIDGSVLAPVDLDILIEAIYVCPTASSALKNEIERINKAYGVDSPVFQSELARVPMY
jgi:hypothetical protein